MKTNHYLFLLAAFVCGALPRSSGAELLVNGNFQAPPILGPGQSDVGMGKGKAISTKATNPGYAGAISGIASWTYALPGQGGTSSDHGIVRTSVFGDRADPRMVYINNPKRLLSQTLTPLRAPGVVAKAQIQFGTAGSDTDGGRAGTFYLVAGEADAKNRDAFSVRSIILDKVVVGNPTYTKAPLDFTVGNRVLKTLTLSHAYTAGDPALLLPLTVAFRTEAGSAGPTYWDNASLTTDSTDATLLLLHFEDSAVGAGGEVPVTNAGVVYTTGVTGKGAFLNDPAQLSYPAAGNFDPTRGTLQFWIRPTWNGNDEKSYTILRQGIGGGVLIQKDGANNLRAIFNRFGASLEEGVGFNVSAWVANEWHHVAFTWGDGILKLFVDGAEVGTNTSRPLPTVAETTFQIGAVQTDDYLAATLDELRISNRPLTAAEIQASYLADLPGVTSISVTPPSASILKGATITPVVQANTALGIVTVPPALVSWTNPSPNVAQVDAQGRILGVAIGTDALVAQVRGRSAAFSLTVRNPALAPQEIPVTAELATPAANALSAMPVVVISYLPTLDGVNLDSAETGVTSTLAAMKARIATMNRHLKFSLEQGSRFRGYKNAGARPALGYRVIKSIVVYEPLPPGKPDGGGANFADYNQILQRFGGEQLVTQQNAREVWLWGYHTAKIVPAESNMSSPTTGDISNSYRFNDDLPIYDRTYVLYNYNFGRGQNEAVHNHGHQLESMFAYACQRQDGNDSLFWDKFCGRGSGVFQQGRCGNTHFPPNATADYDYYNNTPVLSDCEDWRPDHSGQKTAVSAQRWGSLAYAWPGGPEDGQTEGQYYIYWMQNMPGYQNAIPFGTQVMRNWWEFVADWDAAISGNSGLHKTP